MRTAVLIINGKKAGIPALGILPLGTANDFATGCGISTLGGDWYV